MVIIGASDGDIINFHVEEDFYILKGEADIAVGNVVHHLTQ